MTYFTDSEYERMMIQYPKYDAEEKMPIRKPTSRKKKHSGGDHYRDIIISGKKGAAKR